MKQSLSRLFVILFAANIACSQAKAQTNASAKVSNDQSKAAAAIKNPNIDMLGYLAVAKEAAAYRESHRLTEDEFIRLSRDWGTFILDARSAEKYKELHIKGAINLSFPDITVESLRTTLPDKSAQILIYCNNNFVGDQSAFPTKMITASLNLSTYIALYTYGYRNVYELGPLLDVKTTKIEFAGTNKY